MTPTTETEPAPRLDAGPLSLAFTWDGERWRHSLSCAGRPVADSEEGADQPVYQQLHIQHDGDDPVALLVGQSAHRHYSASFRAAKSGGEDRLEIDVAARRLAGDQPLAFGYTLREGIPRPAPAGAEEAGLSFPGSGGLGLAPQSPKLAIGVDATEAPAVIRIADERQPETSVQRAVYHWTWSARSPEDA